MPNVSFNQEKKEPNTISIGKKGKRKKRKEKKNKIT